MYNPTVTIIYVINQTRIKGLKLLHNNRSQIFVFILLICLPVVTWAGFLEMPEITEVPDLERKSLLKDLDIPSVRDRDPDPESGPRLNVVRFKLQGIVEYPELGISKKDIDALIDGIRIELMREYDVEKSGFTKVELEEVSKLLVEIEEETQDRHVTDLELQKLVWLVREQRLNRGITLGTIETVADRITQFYRDRGFMLARAYIPRQEVRDGVVTLTLLLGALGGIDATNSTLYDEEYLAATFDEMLTMPVTSSAVEENLYLINDYPGVLATGFFQSGSQVGDTRLNLDVRWEQEFEANIRFDNHGSEQTGEYRFYAEGLWNNPLGNADQLQVAALLTVEPTNTVYGLLRYSTRILSPRLSASMGFASNDFVLGAGNSESINNLKLEGKTQQADVAFTYRFKRSRTQNYFGVVLFERLKSTIRLGALPGVGDVGLDDIVRNLSLVFRYDILAEQSKILHQGDVKLTTGEFLKGVEVGQDEQYSILNANYSLLTFLNLPYFEASTRLIYRVSLQYASSPLSSISQFSLAGPTKARGYPINQFYADNAVYLGIDWVFDSPELFDIDIGGSNLRAIARPFVFADASWGEVLTLVDTQSNSTGTLLDVGLGIQFSHLDVRGNLQLAFPVSADFSSSDTEAPDDIIKLVLDVQYSF